MVVALGLSDRALHVTRDIAQILVAPAGRPVRPEMLFIHGLSPNIGFHVAQEPPVPI
jgi:hypothetical protein